MIIDYDETIGHGRGYPTGLSHEEKMDVVACLLDEGERTYVNEEHTAWISQNRCAVGEMVTLDESSTMEHTIVRKASEGDLAYINQDFRIDTCYCGSIGGCFQIETEKAKHSTYIAEHQNLH